MANVDSPFGLRPCCAPKRIRPYYKPATLNAALFVGDPVVKTGTANTAAVTVPGAGYFAPGAMPTVDKATAGDNNPTTGIIVGFAARPDALGVRYSPALTEGVVYVADHPDEEFLIQADGAIAATQIGLNAVFIYTTSGNTATGISGVELDTTSDVPAADASNQLTILRLHNAPDNEVGDYAVVVVKINQHTEADNTIGIA